MDEIVNRYARELAEAIAAALAHDERVETCRAKARAAGYDMRVTLEAIVSFANRQQPGEAVARPPVDVEFAYGFRYRRPMLAEGGVALFVSQSGETIDTLAALSYARERGQTIAAIVNVLDPDVFVLGGGLSNVARLYTEVPRLWTRHVFSDHVATRLLLPVHGDSSGVRGAAWLWGGNS